MSGLGVAILVGLGLVGLVGLAWLWRGPMPQQIPPSDRALFRKIFPSVRREFGPAAWGKFPNGLHRFDAHLYTAGYVIMRDLYLGDGAALTRFEREIVATAISVSNRCYYCTHTHSRLVGTESPGIQELITRGRIDEITDARLRGLAGFGQPGPQPLALSREEASDAIVTAMAFNYLNRMLDAVGAPEGRIREMLAKPPPRLFARIVGMKRSFPPGDALARARATKRIHPIDVGAVDRADIARWTLGRTEVMDSVLYAWSTIRRQAREMFDGEVLALIRSHLAQWNGQPPPALGIVGHPRGGIPRPPPGQPGPGQTRPDHCPGGVPGRSGVAVGGLR